MKMSLALRFILLVVFHSIPQISSSESNATHETTQRYIVYMGAASSGAANLSETHHNVLQGVVGSTLARSKLQYSYHRSFSGFTADLTPTEAATISARDDVVSVFPSGELEMLTTRSYDFLGLTMQAPRSMAESDVIIGVIDSGVWPESESFGDDGMGPPPPKWKGVCRSSANFSCNNKIIGARMYYSFPFGKPAEFTPRDDGGHGTHTASTAAGAVVNGANLFGFASGTARGAVPSARIAIYKVCWENGPCTMEDVLAAFDDAIADGVDIISISLGAGRSKSREPIPYQEYALSIGSFHAMTKGVLTSESGGNSGPELTTLSNMSPWSITVAATSIDRKFVTQVQLGNGNTYQGVSLNTFDLGGAMYPLVRCDPLVQGNNKTSSNSTENNFKGKIGICTSDIDVESTLFSAGAVGYLRDVKCNRDVARVMALPGACLSGTNTSEIYAYISNSSDPVATITRSNQIFDPSAPYVASFSSRGPNDLSPSILKPDISAPGVNIIAAWPETFPISELNGDPRVAPFKIISGTSMACPHISGVAAYVKEFNPGFSPAAIKSALMTTATTLDPEENTGGVFAFGSGQVNPAKAISPGLVYDIREEEYIRFLCLEGLNASVLSKMSGRNISCTNAKPFQKWDLNYPAISVVSKNMFFSETIERTVTNVGSTSSNYTVRIKGLKSSMNIIVEPEVLAFKHLGEKLSFAVKVNGKLENSSMPTSGSIVWHDGIHEVYSPIVVRLL